MIEEALKIVIKKEVDMYFIGYCDDVKRYNSFHSFSDKRQLTPEEFILLKGAYNHEIQKGLE